MTDTKRPIFVSAEDLRLYESGLYSVFMVGVETPNRVISIAPTRTQGADDAQPVATDEDAHVIKRLSGVLAEVAVALFGEEADGDAAELLAKLPERAQMLMLEVELYRAGMPCESCGWVYGSSNKSAPKTNKEKSSADVRPDNAPLFTVSGNFVRGPGIAFELPTIAKAGKTADNLNSLYATRDAAPTDAQDEWADLWYFVMDEAPLEFERIVTTVSPSQWHSEAHKLMRDKYPSAQRDK